MPDIGYPIGAPQGVEAGSGLWIQVEADKKNSDTQWVFHVPGGSVWLAQTITWPIGTVVTAGNRAVQLILSDNDGKVVWTSVPTVTVPPSRGGQVAAALGGTDGFRDDGTNVTAQIALPQIMALPGWRWFCELNNKQVGDAISATPRGVFTQWEFRAPGGGGQAALGPFMLVPGPGARIGA